MMNKKSLRGTLLLLILAICVFSSCSKDEGVAGSPTVEIVHLGTHESPDDRILLTGLPAHIEAKIVAPAGIRKIEIEISQKSGYGNTSIKREFTDGYVGQTEIAAFHDHSELAKDIALGAYLFQLTVTDQQGNVGTIESDVTIKSGDGHEPGHNHDG